MFQEWENNNTAGVLIYATLQTSFMFCIFIVCYIGQLLVDEVRCYFSLRSVRLFFKCYRDGPVNRIGL